MTPIASIDPGLGGGIAWVTPSTDGAPKVGCCSMPETERDLVDLIRSLSQEVVEWFVEDVPYAVGFAGPARRMNPAASGKLHGNFGVVRGALYASGARWIRVAPREWQSHFHLGTAKSHGSKWKSVLKAEAQRRFPSLKVTLATADALLILDWARETR